MPRANTSRRFIGTRGDHWLTTGCRWRHLAIDPVTWKLYLVAQESVPNVHYEMWDPRCEQWKAIFAHPTIDPWPGPADEKAAAKEAGLWPLSALALSPAPASPEADADGSH